MILASWLIGYLLSFKQYSFLSIDIKRMILLVGIFLIFTILAALNSDFRYTALFGEHLRRNGSLTYFCFGVLFVTSLLYFKLEDYKILIKYSYLIILLLLTYGLLQLNGKDFVTWNNPYNSIISTVGNPNFAAAIFAIITLIAFGPIFMTNFSIWYRILSALIFLLSIFTIFQSDARQGLIAIGIGSFFYINVWLYSKQKIMGIITSIFAVAVTITGISGMLQHGPLAGLLYKDSVSVRGFYWRAAFEMFKDNPMFGVGVDRYGSYFKEFREVEYTIRYGFDITSTNAHNVPLQLFATSGFFVGILYLLINAYILFMIFRALRKSHGNTRLIIASISSAWLAYQAQSIISIDNIGVAVWGWILGGVIVALSNEVILDFEDSNQMSKSSPTQWNSLSQPLISGALVIGTIVLVSVLLKAESNMLQTRVRFNPAVEANRIPLQEFANKTIETPLVDPTYKIMSASYLVNTGFVNEGITVLNSVLDKDSRNQDVLGLLAVYSQQLGNVDEAIDYRKRIEKLDPWNAQNYFELGKLYRDSGDVSNMLYYLDKIDSFAGALDIANQAKIELVIK